MLLYHSLALFLAAGLHQLPFTSATRLPPTNLDALKGGSKPSTATSSSSTNTPTASPPPEPCTIRSPHTGSFFDLNSLNIPAPGSLPDKSKSKSKPLRDYSWNATGWDMGYNFTMNFCGAVVEDLDKLGGVVDVERDSWRNISAYYRKDGKVVSIGQENATPVIRGRKLVLNYTDGSPCDSPHSRSIDSLSFPDTGRWDTSDESREIISPGSGSSGSKIRRKSTIISLLCEKDPLLPQLTLSFVAASQDECTYFFEARTHAACPTLEQRVQTLSPSGVFGVIAIIAIIVYLVGGCVYSRMVLQQRGWRQVPNYNLWAGILGFFRDLLIIITTTCLRCLPFRRHGNSGFGSSGGFGGNSGSNFGHSDGGRGGGGVNGNIHRGRDSDAENRLIDELNEEWDD